MTILARVLFVGSIFTFGVVMLNAQDTGEFRVFNVGAQTSAGNSTAKHAINTKGAGSGDKIKPDPSPTSRQYVGHITLIKRTIAPRGGETTEPMQPLTTVPASGEKITVYTITKIETDSAEFAAKYPKLSSIGVLATSLGKTVAIPYLIFDLPAPPSGLKFHYQVLKPEVTKLPDMPEPEDPVLHFRTGNPQGELSYQTMLDGKPVKLRLTIAPTETVLGQPAARGIAYWNVALGTRCAPPLLVQIEAGTTESASTFFNQVCDAGLR